MEAAVFCSSGLTSREMSEATPAASALADSLYVASGNHAAVVVVLVAAEVSGGDAACVLLAAEC